MTRIALVVTDPEFYADDPDPDTPLILDLLLNQDVPAEMVVWHDPEVDWSAYDLAVLRSPWDYPLRPAEFDRWLQHVAPRTRVLNEPHMVRWNMDKHYLDDLASAGITVVPTSYHRSPGSAAEALTRAAQEGVTGGADGPAHVVVKPTVGSRSRLAGLFRADDPAAQQLAEAIIADGAAAMIQPEVPELSEGLEKAVYMVDGQFTHAIAKGALLARGGGMIGGIYGENAQVVEVTEEEKAFVRQVLEAVMKVNGTEMPLYARIDIVDTARYGKVLLEAELIEPLLNLHHAPGVEHVFAEAIRARA